MNLFYAGILKQACPDDRKKLMKKGLPIQKLEQDFPYLLGEGRSAGGKLQIYYALLPEYSGKTLWKGRPKKWKRQNAEQLAEQAMERAFQELECREQIVFPETDCDFRQIPVELLAACLYRYRPFNRICISFPEDEMRGCAEQVIRLITPYLPRMRQVMLVGDAKEEDEILENYLYEEFGIVMMRGRRAPSHMLWLNLGGERYDGILSSMESCALQCVYPGGALKFLDTVVKNGYNTKVNQK